MGGREDMKIVVLGNSNCGKTSLVKRYVNHDNTNVNHLFHDESYKTTIEAAYHTRLVNHRRHELNVGVWDTAGSERYRAISRLYYRNAKAAIVCYDITNFESVQCLKFWVEELNSNEEGCHIYLCGTKLDLVESNTVKRCIDFSEMLQYANEMGATLTETSSLTGENIESLFTLIVDDYVKFVENLADFYHAGFDRADFVVHSNNTIHLNSSKNNGGHESAPGFCYNLC